jgi:hypothetical protein
VRFDARIVEKSKTWGKEGSDQGGEIVKFLRLVSNGWDGFGADGREIDRAVAFFVNLANEDAETCKKMGERNDQNSWRKADGIKIGRVWNIYQYVAVGKERTSCHP